MGAAGLAGVGMSGIPFVCQSLTCVLTGMGRPGICCCVRNVHDLDARHLVQVRVTHVTCDCHVHIVTRLSARLPGSTVALFSTLQPLFTGILGLIGIFNLFRVMQRVAVRFPLPSHLISLQFLAREFLCRRDWVVLQLCSVHCCCRCACC